MQSGSPGLAASPSVARQERFYHPELDGLRFFAFLAVFLHHAMPQGATAYLGLGLPNELAQWLAAATRGGGLGVDFFFVLSSYLITELLIREHRRHGSIDFRSFLVRRALRIWPLYYVFILIAAFVLPSLTGEGELSQTQLLSFLFFFANWECVWNGYPASVVAPLWSVAIEEQFYLVWPLVVRVFTPARLVWALIAMVLLGFGARWLLVSEEVPHPGIWCNTFTHLDAIAFGALAAIRLQGRPLSLGRYQRIALMGLGALGILVVSRLVDFAAPLPSYHLVWAYSAVAACCVLILVGALRPTGERARLLAHPALVYLGRVSYGLYVFHILGIQLSHQAAEAAGLSTTLVAASQLFLGFLFTVVLAALSYRFLERPFLRLKHRFTRVESRAE